MMRSSKKSLGTLSVLWMVIGFAVSGFAPVMGQAGSETKNGKEMKTPVLIETIMCEKIGNQAPINPSVVFPVTVNNAYCYTLFNEIQGKTHIWHRWYRKDVLITKIKLYLEPPLWSTYSGITIRESDKGPWRVEITDKNGVVLAVKRFSISD